MANPTTPRTLSDAATQEILGADLSFLVAYSNSGEPVIFAPDGKKVEQMSFPLPYPPTEMLGMTSTTTIKAVAKCVVYINGVPYCVAC